MHLSWGSLLAWANAFSTGNAVSTGDENEVKNVAIIGKKHSLYMSSRIHETLAAVA